MNSEATVKVQEAGSQDAIQQATLTNPPTSTPGALEDSMDIDKLHRPFRASSQDRIDTSNTQQMNTNNEADV